LRATAGATYKHCRRPSPRAPGEAVGINYVSAADKPALIARMAEVADAEYFERGIELLV
jgi:hypothetical protein